MISIHALREEGDLHRVCAAQAFGNFNPRPPRGGRPDHREAVQEAQEISIHALREEGDGRADEGRLVDRISIHALREEGDLR